MFSDEFLYKYANRLNIASCDGQSKNWSKDNVLFNLETVRNFFIRTIEWDAS